MAKFVCLLSRAGQESTVGLSDLSHGKQLISVGGNKVDENGETEQNSKVVGLETKTMS